MNNLDPRSPLDRRQWMLCAASILVAGILAFTGLTDNKFWDDEANTAIFARNLLSSGDLTAWDGTNLIGYRDGAELDENLNNVFMPPLQYWVAAAGIACLGGGEFGARALFVLLGLMCMVGLAFLARELMGDRVEWHIPLWLLALSPAYLLYIRNCRYYAPGAALSIALLALVVVGTGSDRRPLIRAMATLLCASLLMLTSYFNAVGTIAAMPVILMFRRYRTRRHLFVMGAALIGTAAVGAYVMATANPFAAPVPRPDEMEGISRILTLLCWNLRDLGTFEFFPVVLLLAIPLPFLIPRMASSRPTAWAGILVAGMMLAAVITTALFSPQSASGSTIADMRYLVPLIPLGAILTALNLGILWRLARPVAAVALALVTFTNLLHLGFLGTENAYLPPRGVECTLCQYAGEVLSERTTNTEAIISYLEKLPEDDVLMIVPPFMGYSPMYYLPEREFCCQLLEDHPVHHDLRATLPDRIFWEEAQADRAIINAMPPSSPDGPLVIRGIMMGNYQLVDTLDIPARDCSRPEIPWHSFDGRNVNDQPHHKFFVVKVEQ